MSGTRIWQHAEIRIINFESKNRFECINFGNSVFVIIAVEIFCKLSFLTLPSS
jgi:hypothetical protein